MHKNVWLVRLGREEGQAPSESINLRASLRLLLFEINYEINYGIISDDYVTTLKIFYQVQNGMLMQDFLNV